MLDPVDEHDHLFVVNLVDYAVVTASGRMEAFQLPEQRFPEALSVFCDRAKDGCKACFAYLLRESVQVSKAFRCDFDRIHVTCLDVVFEP
jgi:hypothetical protein